MICSRSRKRRRHLAGAAAAAAAKRRRARTPSSPPAPRHIQSFPPQAGPAVRPAAESQWKLRLKSPVFVSAPLVNQSEAAWRAQVRRYGTDLCFTPMLLAEKLNNSPAYRAAVLDVGHTGDRPVVVQLAAAVASDIISAAQGILSSGLADAFDINLGCPQDIARRGCYGGFMPEEEAVGAVRGVSAHSACTVKIRRSTTVEDTLRRILLFQDAGACAVTLHGRTAEDRPRHPPDWEHVRAVVNDPRVHISIISNGGIQCPEDVWRCLETTGAAAVMSGVALLRDPALFQRARKAVKRRKALPGRLALAEEYLRVHCAARPPSHISIPRKHVYWVCGSALERNVDVYDTLYSATAMEGLLGVVTELQRREREGVECVDKPRPATLEYTHIWTRSRRDYTRLLSFQCTLRR
eukprot:Hpha_TRINITY_DN17936_c0_g1::TRINITY_DN17936_c0_g1_i1::g.33808::m.33808/K05542/DUS1; tRNA-dihydrouridine synthase 1